MHLFGCYNVLSSSKNLILWKEIKLAKVNYQYEKRQKELAKKRKKEQKEKLKQLKKNSGSQETQEAQDAQATSEDNQESLPVQQPEK